MALGEPSHQIAPVGDVAPLVAAAQLDAAPMQFVKLVKVVGLKDRVGKLSIGEPSFGLESIGNDLFAQQRTHPQYFADIPQVVQHVH